ncbi:hypothetical protein PP707_05160, partial [Acetobacter pasteurianus]|nr:hypothetical protein [Acetobacter pasteurianus]
AGGNKEEEKKFSFLLFYYRFFSSSQFSVLSSQFSYLACASLLYWNIKFFSMEASIEIIRDFNEI